ncbi:Mannosyl-glycoprotein endo-beta-N-acetylglucosamidase [Burkholderia sp. 8Y]|uniref:hypothetical protein n=1 Tax=Burkholderia sp. 8Y TaxID=2653133 RepID=UPI0012F18F5F|nr:hypothetical protein [Burkholderia sp. 8Y]VXB25245.1 Mannosyl-glycoprotein endo-beta-N-acetylglucosamidase [Burkholderia sp. 8Y]
MNEEVIKEFLVKIGYQTDETSLRKFTLSLASVTKKVMALGAVVAATAAAVVAGVKVISAEMERLYYASQRTGETVGNIMALRFAAGQIGLTAEQAQASLEGFTRTLRLNPGMNGLLTQLGVTGNGPLEQFESFIGKMKQMQPYIAAQYAGLFGIDPDTLLMLENGLPKLQAAQAKYQEKLGAFHINPERAAQAGVDFDNSVRDLTSDIHLFWVLLQEHLAPVLATISSEFEKWAAGHADETARKIATALEAVAKWVQEIDWQKVGKDVDIFLDKAGKVAKVLGNIVGSFAKVAAWFAGGDDSDDAAAGNKPAGPRDGKDETPPDARPDDSPFLAWVRRKRYALQKWAGSAQKQPATHPDAPASQSDSGNGRRAKEGQGPSSAPRGIRNNNPGNIRYGEFARSAGAIGADSGGFAVFADMHAGIEATARLLRSYAARGFNTIRTIISRWAPANENDTQAYIAEVSKKLGISADVQLDADQLRGVAGSIFQHENGASYRNLGDSLELASKNVGAVTSRNDNAAYGKLGATAAPAASKSVTISQKTDVHVHGSPDPGGTGRAVASEQSRVNGDLVRNMTGAFV